MLGDGTVCVKAIVGWVVAVVNVVDEMNRVGIVGVLKIGINSGVSVTVGMTGT